MGASSPVRSADATVTILLATHNGATHLAAQLQSIAAQKGCDWRLIASDDASSDTTPEILARFSDTEGHDRVRLLQGPGKGAVENFRFLLSQASAGSAVAYCDQDDIWQPEKLQRALAALEAVPEGTPALYGSTVRPVDAAGRPLGHHSSRAPKRPLGLRNALLQNVFQGNTIVLNAPAVSVLQAAEARLRAADVRYVMHDWWAYMLVSAVGGVLIFDPVPGLCYRQHQGNMIGTNDGVRASLTRLHALLKGRNAEWMTRHLNALSCLEEGLTHDSRVLLAILRAARGKGVVGRVAGFWKAGIYLQRRRAQLGFWLAVLAGRI